MSIEEKAIDQHPALQNPPRARLRAPKWILIALCCVLVYFKLSSERKDDAPVPTPAERGELSLAPCEDGDHPYLCGNLTAPLNYANLSDPRNASVAVVVYPAGGGTTPKSEIIGSLILNPGGPGGSGCNFIFARLPVNNNRTMGEAFDTLLNGKYNIISFDPRGVGKTWPRVPCFTDELDSLYFHTSVLANGLPGQHGARVMKHEIGTSIAQEQLFSDVCQKSKDAELMQYVGTAFVVRDMQLLHRALGDEKLHYWGFSYGTVLGSTYADMFPDDVGRLVIDGVVDVPNYYQGKWSHCYKDTEAELDAFFREAVDSEHPLGKLAPTGPELKQLVMDWGTRLKQHPVALADAKPPQIFTYHMFIAGIFKSLYTPATWPSIADGLHAAITENNYSKLSTSPDQILGSDAIMQIACGDNLNDSPESWGIKEYEQYIKSMRNDSPLFADFLGQIGLMCGGIWPVRAAERHRGNFTSETSFPLLMLGNDLDPVTPGRHADKMAQLFPNAVSVRREGYGHCSLSQPSKCIDETVRKYFLEGELPALGTVCTVDEPVFGNEMMPNDGFAVIFDEAIRKANVLPYYNSRTDSYLHILGARFYEFRCVTSRREVPRGFKADAVSFEGCEGENQLLLLEKNQKNTIIVQGYESTMIRQSLRACDMIG